MVFRSLRLVLSKTRRPLLITLSVLLICSFGYTAEPKPELKKTDTQKASGTPAKPVPPPKFNVGDFMYTSKSRRDPFEPIFLEKIKERGKEFASNTAKSGYELEELKLVGIMRAGNKNLAMMEDMQGKGILFKKNDYLNKNLWIVDVLHEKVEFGYKIKGEIRTFTIEIPRKKEGM